MGNHYETLGVAPNATSQEIKAAYRRKMRAAHPDMTEGRSTDAAAAITLAYAVLSKPAERGRYDQTLTIHHRHNSRPDDIRLSDPVEFPQQQQQSREATQARKRKDGLFGIFFNAPKTKQGKVSLIFFGSAVVFWVLAAAISLLTAGQASNGLFGLVLFASILSLALPVIDPVRRPWLAIITAIFLFLLPVDHLTGQKIFPAFLNGLSEWGVYGLEVMFFAAIAAGYFWRRTKRVVVANS